MPILDDKYYIYPFKNRFSNLHIDLAPQMILQNLLIIIYKMLRVESMYKAQACDPFYLFILLAVSKITNSYILNFTQLRTFSLALIFDFLWLDLQLVSSQELANGESLSLFSFVFLDFLFCKKKYIYRVMLVYMESSCILSVIQNLFNYLIIIVIVIIIIY